MRWEFLNPKNQKNLIEGVKLFPLKVNRDQRGVLVETLKKNWPEVFGKNLPFAQAYYSITNPGIARDEKLWHYHPTSQVDRFVVIKGKAVFALYDWRLNSKTKGTLNLFLMGEENGDEGQFLLLIPKNVLHGFTVVGKNPCYLLNFPTRLYDKKEEGRVGLAEVGVKFLDGTPFSWEIIRQYFK